MQDSLDDNIRRILKEKPKIAEAVEKDPNLRNALISSYEKASEDGKGLVYAGKFIDFVNKPLAVLKTAGMISGPGTGYLIKGLTKIGQLVFMKLPYSIYYGSKGGNKKKLATIGAFEAVKYFVPFGDVGDLLPVYENSAKQYVLDKTEENFNKYLESRTPAEIIPIEVGRKKLRNLDDVLKQAA